MNKVMTISIAAYNVESYLRKCLDSLLIPSMEKIEVLIQNDGSKDQTAAIAREYEEKYPEVFRLVNKENGGYGSTINNSIRMATGKYFKQLDADDWYDTENLENLINILEKTDVDCVYTPYIEHQEETGIQETHAIAGLKVGVQSIEDTLEDSYFVHMHVLAFRTELMRTHNVTILEHCFYTDVEYVVYPLIHCKKAFVWDKPIYYYRVGREGQSVSIEGWRKHHAEHAHVIREILSHFDEIQAASPRLRFAVMRRLSHMLRLQYVLDLTLGDQKQELVELDRHIHKQYPEFFEFSKPYLGRTIQLLRLSNYILYPVLRKKFENS